MQEELWSLLVHLNKSVKMKEVILPEGLISIGNNAFLGCKTLEKINFPDSLKYIGDKSFYECTSFQMPKTSFNLPPGKPPRWQRSISLTMPSI